MEGAKLASDTAAGGDDQGFALVRKFSFAPQELDANGAIHFSIGEKSPGHHNIRAIVDFIEDGVFDSLRFHRCSAYESGCPANAAAKTIAHNGPHSEGKYALRRGI